MPFLNSGTCQITWLASQRQKFLVSSVGVYLYYVGPMGPHEESWFPMGPHGSPWVSMGSHGSPWVPMGSHGVPMGPHGFSSLGPILWT